MSEHSEEHHMHILPIRAYVLNLLALMFLMAATVAASYIHFPFQGGDVLNNFIAMAIATMKALLVIAFFMHVKYGSTLVKFWAMIGFVWFTLLSLILMDYGTRKWEPIPGWSPASESSFNRDIHQPLDDSGTYENVRRRAAR